MTLSKEDIAAAREQQKDWAEDTGELIKLRAENAKLRQALSWYADENNWEAWENDSEEPTEYQNHDGGERAREALKSE